MKASNKNTRSANFEALMNAGMIELLFHNCKRLPLSPKTKAALHSTATLYSHTSKVSSV